MIRDHSERSPESTHSRCGTRLPPRNNAFLTVQPAGFPQPTCGSMAQPTQPTTPRHSRQAALPAGVSSAPASLALLAPADPAASSSAGQNTAEGTACSQYACMWQGR